MNCVSRPTYEKEEVQEGFSLFFLKAAENLEVSLHHTKKNHAETLKLALNETVKAV